MNKKIFWFSLIFAVVFASAPALFVSHSEASASPISNLGAVTGQYKSIAECLNLNVAEPEKSTMASTSEMTVCAGPIDGTWKISSGNIDVTYLGKNYSGYLDTKSVKPSKFEVQMMAQSGGDFAVLINKGNDVTFTWKITSLSDIKDKLISVRGFQKISETEYYGVEDDVEALLLLNNSTLVLTYDAIEKDMSISVTINFERAGDISSSDGGGGCNAGLGFLALAFLVPFVRRRK